MSSQRTVYLTPPRISSDHIKEKITCIRAHKERIFETSLQVYNGKLICHNYGQGGAGFTFLFGCVNESIRQLEEYIHEHSDFKDKPITIIGAGCYGLLTALTLARKGYTVNIVAADTQAIPSYKAAGFFFPRARKCSTPQEIAIFKARGIESYTTYQQIAAGTHPFLRHGARVVPCYFDPAIDPGFGPYLEEGLINPTEQVTIDFGNGKQYSVMEYHALFIETTALLQELHRLREELGILITKAEIASFDEVDAKIIVNCTGLGAKKLTGDTRIVPVQGHLITLKDQPAANLINYMINVRVTVLSPEGRPRDELIYYAPKGEGILGITFIRGQDSLTANQHEFDRLLERCKGYFGHYA